VASNKRRYGDESVRTASRHLVWVSVVVVVVVVGEGILCAGDKAIPYGSTPMSSSADIINRSASLTGYGGYAGGACTFQKTKSRSSRPDGRETSVSHSGLACLTPSQE
jgi:hypothetical protein